MTRIGEWRGRERDRQTYLGSQPWQSRRVLRASSHVRRSIPSCIPSISSDTMPSLSNFAMYHGSWIPRLAAREKNAMLMTSCCQRTRSPPQRLHRSRTISHAVEVSWRRCSIAQLLYCAQACHLATLRYALKIALRATSERL